MNPHDLPVYTQKERILQALEKNQVIVVESPTGSGKTTQIPLILHEAGYTSRGILGITQPRRIAAVSVCDYIARQLGESIPGLAGYKMRFEDQTTPDTRIKILTDGTLLQEMKGDPYLSRYGVLIVDEAHERTLNIDFILGLVKGILPQRPDFKVIISSATLNPLAFSQYFDNCPVVSIETPVYPVETHYDPPPIEGDQDALISKILQRVETILDSPEKGDILIFLTGEKMIKDTAAGLLASSRRRELQVMPLYGRLSKEEQERVFDPAAPGRTKVVCSTNITETSVTIDGVTAVIDTGLAKINYYNPRTFTSALVESGISRAAADQRRGRAGRTQPGSCWRLYSEQKYNESPEFTQEEIYRTDLAEVVLRMAELDIQDFEAFPFPSSPDRKGISGAVEALKLLDALDDNNTLTEIGRMMTPYPLLPRHARMIVEASLHYPKVLREVIITASFLSTNPPFLLPQGREAEARRAHHAFRSEHFGDFASYINLYWAYHDAPDKDRFAQKYYLDRKIMDEIVNIQGQLEEILSRRGILAGEGGPTEDFLKACARGLLPYICIRDGRFNYRSVGAEKIIIHPGSVLFRENPEFIVAGEIVHTSRTYARSVSPLKEQWLEDIAPGLVSRLKVAPSRRRSSPVPAKKKDSTNQIWIAGEAFALSRSPGKGNRRRALMDWEKLHSALQRLEREASPDLGTLRGTLIFKNDEVMPDSKLNTILKVARELDPRKDLVDAPPGGNFHIQKTSHREELVNKLTFLLKVTPGGKRKKRGMNFIGLYCDGGGHYWFRSGRSFHTVINTSLESLENLIDDLGESSPEEEEKALNRAYRRVERLFY